MPYDAVWIHSRAPSASLRRRRGRHGHAPEAHREQLDPLHRQEHRGDARPRAGARDDPRRFLEAISGGAMDMPYAHMQGEAILNEDFPPSFPLRLARKDVALILEAVGGTSSCRSYEPRCGSSIAPSSSSTGTRT
jgi:hypothetical protein